ncbi:carboxypeptidase-like regulatory domain-containing protein [Streptomyces sp. M10(2022)]
MTLINRQGGQAGRTVADQEGRYALPAAPGAGYVLAATATGYAHRRPGPRARRRAHRWRPIWCSPSAHRSVEPRCRRK